MERTDQHRIAEIQVNGKLLGRETAALVSSICPLLKHHSVTDASLLGEKYVVNISSGGSRQLPLAWETVQRVRDRLEARPARWASIDGVDRFVDPPRGGYVMRGVSITSSQSDTVIEKMVDAAINKAEQLPAAKPGAVIVGFARSLLPGQPSDDRLHLALESLTLPKLSRKPAVSAAIYLFDAGWIESVDAVGRRGVHRPVTVHLLVNPNANAVSLPSGVRAVLANQTSR